MKEFMTDANVMDRFKEVSLKQSCFPCMHHSQEIFNAEESVTYNLVNTAKKSTLPSPLRLHSKNVDAYRSDQLSKLVAGILNPGTFP